MRSAKCQKEIVIIGLTMCFFLDNAWYTMQKLMLLWLYHPWIRIQRDGILHADGDCDGANIVNGEDCVRDELMTKRRRRKMT